MNVLTPSGSNRFSCAVANTSVTRHEAHRPFLTHVHLIFLCPTTLRRYYSLQTGGCGNPASSKSIGAVFPTGTSDAQPLLAVKYFLTKICTHVVLEPACYCTRNRLKYSVTSLLRALGSRNARASLYWEARLTATLALARRCGPKPAVSPRKPVFSTRHESVTSDILLFLQFTGKETETRSGDTICHVKSHHECVAGT